VKFENAFTGRVFGVKTDKISKSLYKFRVACRAIDRIYSDVSGLQLYFLTLTLNGSNTNKLNKDLNKFIDFLRKRFDRAGLPFYYVWVVELQKKRYLKYGVKARHWHFVILCSKGALPNVRFDKLHYPHYKVLNEGSLIKQKDLFERWGYGQVFCKYAWSKDVQGYLEKYFKKGFKSEISLRRFGSSDFSYYAYPKWAYDSILNGSVVYSDMVLLKKGSTLEIIGLDSQGNQIESVKIRSPWVKKSDFY
jgi:hypothetical protein